MTSRGEDIRRNRLEEMGFPGYGRNPPTELHRLNKPSNVGRPLMEVLKECEADENRQQQSNQGERIQSPSTKLRTMRRLVYVLVAAVGVSLTGNYVQWNGAAETEEENQMLGKGINTVLRKNDDLTRENFDLRLGNLKLEMRQKTNGVLESMHRRAQENLRVSHDDVSLPQNANGVADDLHDGRRADLGQHAIINE